MPSAVKTKAPRGLQPTPAPRGCTNFKLRALVRRVSRHYDLAMAGVGLKTTQYSLLSHVFKQGPVGSAVLAASMSLSASTLSRNLRPLINAGWLELQAGADARSHRVTITAAGRAKRTEAQRRWHSAQVALNHRLGLPLVAALHQLIDDALPLLESGDCEDTDEPT